MPNEDKPLRHWRVIAQEMATEKDPAKLRALWEEMNNAIRLVRFDETDDAPPDNDVIQ
jgi:hypothetical protein